MTNPELFFIGACEAAGLFIIVRMWWERWHRRLLARWLWTVVLLVPIVGLPTYFFLRDSPEEHPHECQEFESPNDGHGHDGQ